jgi:hypothetical protein
MARYVAIGNSINRGRPVGGISARTQAEAYPARRRARARAVRRTVVAAAVRAARPPVSAFARPSDPRAVRASALRAHAGRSPTSSTTSLCGRELADVTDRPLRRQPAHHALLGGRTQVQRAAEYDRRSSASGSHNDVRRDRRDTAAPRRRRPSRRTTTPLAGLADTRAAREQRGLLIGVLDVTNVRRVRRRGARRRSATARRSSRAFSAAARCSSSAARDTPTLVSLAFLLQLSAAVAPTRGRSRCRSRARRRRSAGARCSDRGHPRRGRAGGADRACARTTRTSGSTARAGWRTTTRTPRSRLRQIPGDPAGPILTTVPAPRPRCRSTHPPSARARRIANDVIGPSTAVQTTIPWRRPRGPRAAR